MIDNDILYVIELKDTLSKNTKLIYSNNRIREINLGFLELINSMLLKDLTTLKGRKEALRIKYGFRKNPPLYLNEDITFFSCFFVDFCYHINAKMIQELLKSTISNEVIILFKDGTSLKLNKSRRFIQNYWKRALLIQKVR